MAELVNSSDADVILNTTSRPVKVTGKPLVTIVQNIEPVQRAAYPMPLAWRLRLWLLRRETGRACRQSTRVIAVSNALKEELGRRFGLTNVHVVYHGFKGEARCQRPDRPLPERFIFTAGSIVPYRGYEDIILAIAQLRKTGGLVLPVLVAGMGSILSRSYESRLRRLAVRQGVAKDIHWLGQLTDAEMAWCYQNADLFVQTSRAESFSNIQVEALGNGALVISCTQPPMPEILGEAAIYYPTGNARALADALRQVGMMEPAEVGRWKSAARQRAVRFSWDQTAMQTLDVLESAVVGDRDCN